MRILSGSLIDGEGISIIEEIDMLEETAGLDLSEQDVALIVLVGDSLAGVLWARQDGYFSLATVDKYGGRGVGRRLFESYMEL